MLIPDICCFIYSIYFVLFKQVDYPKFMQFLCIFIVETLYAIGRGVFVFFVAPYFSKSLNISVGWFITLAPILMNLTSKKESIKMFSRLCPNKLGQIIMRFKKFLVLCVWGLGIAIFCFTPTVSFQNISVIMRHNLCPRLPNFWKNSKIHRILKRFKSMHFDWVELKTMLLQMHLFYLVLLQL